jgi:hypothetical protein
MSQKDFIYFFSLGFVLVFSHSPGWPVIYSVTQDNLELVTLLPQLPQCWDYKCALPFLAQKRCLNQCSG